MHAMLPLHMPHKQRGDAAALACLARIYRAASWRLVALTDLQTLLALYKSPAPPRVTLLQQARVRHFRRICPIAPWAAFTQQTQRVVR